MTLTRWDPFNDLLRIQERMNRMFEDTVHARPEGEAGDRGAWTPPVDIYETADRVVLLADLPGVNPGELEVRVESSALILRGERRLEKEVEEESFHRMERGYGPFQRTFNLPATINQEGIRAEHRNGVLRVSLPKAESARPKRIPVEMKPGS
jgi:HSP20 family protein